VLYGLTSLAVAGCARRTPPPETRPTWTTELDRELDRARDDGRVPGQHGLVVTRAGHRIYERYTSGEDWRLGQSLGIVTFDADTLHDLRSVTKSVVGLLYGIALAEGKVPPPDAPLLAQFPEYADLARDDARKRWTIAHALTMTLGTEWDELTLPYSDPKNSERMMDAAPDRHRYVLDRPIVAGPGARWIYNGGTTALLGALIARGAGQPLEAFARRVLFDPLAITTQWSVDRRGIVRAASGLRMTPRDLAKIGQLMIDRGAWQERQIVPAAWVERCMTPAIVIDARRYSYHWYVADFSVGSSLRVARFVGGAGYGGQRLYAFPDDALVVAITAGNYTRRDQGMIASVLMRTIVLPHVLG